MDHLDGWRGERGASDNLIMLVPSLPAAAPKQQNGVILGALYRGIIRSGKKSMATVSNEQYSVP